MRLLKEEIRMIKEMTMDEMVGINGGRWIELAPLPILKAIWYIYKAGKITYDAYQDYKENWTSEDVEHWMEIHGNSVYID